MSHYTNEEIANIADYMRTTDALFMKDVNNELYNSEYIYIPYVITNAGIAYMDAVFTNDSWETFPTDAMVYRVDELEESYDDIIIEFQAQCERHETL